jgi:hypothetical protein
MAMTGSILAARAAGIIPETTPIAEETPAPTNTFLKVSESSRVPKEINDRR